mmetsp:Transcript_1844/g.5402  ORF Transcript_1844/g.5402 Transcript_1844/m.5402 type:complete len:625 (-) Transcript_1844:225-2099(-)|eukprot:CAMPEP_0206145492 /NCGR_PEP_ID=MMETSP1473-20131121/27528_1 /ASSEMBLY_ACC=CAM_ASM_001109 /TAXON_ID=1461547 /ORGANISM="Stichococcus sp, Strain RCC1054" /LENGTH=624 /DNA_ID=CAMNT_0053541731 /DNA_START=167 /DNA_END=2041 /DNA_ORIENTATION=+
MRFGICVALLAHLQLISCLHGAKLQLSKHLSGSAAVGGGSHAQMQHNPLELYRAKNVPYYSFGDDASVTLTVNETTLTHSGQWVEVCWKDLPFPSTDDYVALIVPSNALLNETAPAKYQWAARSDRHLTHGHGCLKFRLLNMRQAVRFVLLRNGFEFPTPAAHSQQITVANPNEPTGGHLALTGQQGEMMVQWTTLDAAHPEVRWGTRRGHWPYRAAADTAGYTRDDMCGGPAAGDGWIDPGSLHRAVLTGLHPDTKYYYSYGDEEHGWSEELSFMAAPAVGVGSAVRLLAIADMGQAEVDGSNENGFGEQHPSLATVRGLLRHSEGRRLVIHNGDISYARGYQSQWEVFFDQIEPLATRMPWMTVGGNHERDWPASGDRYGAATDSGGECGVAYDRRLKMPRKSEEEPWYSFDFGPIHFLQYSTEVPFSKGSPQYRWIQEDLSAVNRSRTPWLIVGGHRPFYIDSTNSNPSDGDQTVASDLREALEEAFVQHKVDMTWHGHHHSYQRTCPVINSKCQGYDSDGAAKAPVHLVIGNAGADLCWNVQPRTPAHFEVVAVAWGWMKVDANATHLTCEAMSDSSAGVEGRILDRFTLIKSGSGNPTTTRISRPWLGSKLGAILSRLL